MRTPNVGDVVTVLRYVGRVERTTVERSYKRRFIVGVIDTLTCTQRYLSFERCDEGKRWMRGWDTFDAVAWRAEKALAACR